VGEIEAKSGIRRGEIHQIPRRVTRVIHGMHSRTGSAFSRVTCAESGETGAFCDAGIDPGFVPANRETNGSGELSSPVQRAPREPEASATVLQDRATHGTCLRQWMQRGRTHSEPNTEC
jgi:hypothetical protein